MKLFTCCWRRQKNVSPALPSVPGEVLRDFLLPLDRWTLDDAQFTCRRFLRLITEHMSDVCLREIRNTYFDASSRCYVIDEYGANTIRVYDRPFLPIRKPREYIARLFSQFVQTLRSAHVDHLTLYELDFTPELAALVLKTPIVAAKLSLCDGSGTELTRTLFHKVLLHFSPTVLFVCSTYQLRTCQFTDEFIRALYKNRVLRIASAGKGPVDGDNYCVTDDAIVEFCAQPDAQIDQKPEEFEELTLHSGRFTKDLFKRLVQASSVSMRMRPLLIKVSPVRFEDEDLRDYAQHLSDRDRGQPWQWRVYDFPCKQHGAATAMRLRIVLNRNELSLTRARQIQERRR